MTSRHHRLCPRRPFLPIHQASIDELRSRSIPHCLSRRLFHRLRPRVRACSSIRFPDRAVSMLLHHQHRSMETLVNRLPLRCLRVTHRLHSCRLIHSPPLATSCCSSKACIVFRHRCRRLLLDKAAFSLRLFINATNRFSFPSCHINNLCNPPGQVLSCTSCAKKTKKSMRRPRLRHPSLARRFVTMPVTASRGRSMRRSITWKNSLDPSLNMTRITVLIMRTTESTQRLSQHQNHLCSSHPSQRISRGTLTKILSCIILDRIAGATRFRKSTSAKKT